MFSHICFIVDLLNINGSTIKSSQYDPPAKITSKIHIPPIWAKQHQESKAAGVCVLFRREGFQGDNQGGKNY